jgi:hypothetical protein
MEAKKGRYQHYKGQYYELIDVVIHSETEQELVLYKPLHSDAGKPARLWVRPYEMFFEQVEKDGHSVPRFAFIGAVNANNHLDVE